jgi:flagellar L-ring protein precursor FlgH
MKIIWILLATALPVFGQTQSSAAELDAYIERSVAVRESNAPSAGSLFTSTGFLAEVARDPRAARVGDLVTVIVSEQASALTSGSTSQSRDSATDSSISRLLGIMGAGRPLPNLFGQSSNSSLDGQASTSRSTNVTAVVTAHVTQVMPNGNLIIEGAKESPWARRGWACSI